MTILKREVLTTLSKFKMLLRARKKGIEARLCKELNKC